MNLRLLPTKDENAYSIVKRWVLTFFLITFALQVWKIFSLNATYDQGLFLQEIWNGLHGRPFESTLASELSAPVMFEGALPQLGYRHLAQHFTPLLLAWLPAVGVLGLWALPLIQVSLLSIAGWVLFLLGKEHLPAKLAGWITCSYFATGLVIGPSLENFHDLCLVPILVFSLLLGISKQSTKIYFIPALLLPLVREDVGLLSFAIGCWMILRKPKWRIWGLCFCIYSLLAVIVITNWAMPMFGSELTDRFMQERFGQYLDNQPGGTLTVLTSMARQPILLFRELISPPSDTFRFLLTLGLPLAFIPFVSLDAWLLISVPLFVALSSKGGNALAVSLRFVLYLVPGIFAGTIFWWQKQINLFHKPKFRRFWKACILIAFLFAIAGNPHRSLSALIPDSIDPWVHIPIQEQWRRGLSTKQLLSSLPSNASVAAETHLIPQLAMRRVLLRFPENDQYQDHRGKVQGTDLIISQPRFNASYAPAFRHQARWVSKSVDRMENLVISGKYGVRYCDQQSIVLERNTTSAQNQIKCFSNELEHARMTIRQLSTRKS